MSANTKQRIGIFLLILLGIFGVLFIVNPGSPRYGFELGEDCEPSTFRARLKASLQGRTYWLEQQAELNRIAEARLIYFRSLATAREKSQYRNTAVPEYIASGKALSLEEQLLYLPDITRQLYDVADQIIVDDIRWSIRCRDYARLKE